MAPAWRRVYTENGTRFEERISGEKDRDRLMTVSQKERLDEGSLSMKGQRQWEPMRVTYLGNVAEVVQQGGGKISILTGDPGEPRKVAPTG